MNYTKEKPDTHSKPAEAVETADTPIFTLEERRAVENWFAHFQRTHPEIQKAAKEMTDADVIDGLEATLHPLEEIADNKATSTLAEAVIKAKKTLKAMQANIQALASEVPSTIDGRGIENYIAKFTQYRAKFPLSIRANMATINIMPALQSDETLSDLSNPNKDRENIEQLEKYIAALLFWCRGNGLSLPCETEDIEKARKTFMEAVSRTITDLKITGTIENMNLHNKLSTLKKELISKGIIITS